MYKFLHGFQRLKEVEILKEEQAETVVSRACRGITDVVAFAPPSGGLAEWFKAIVSKTIGKKLPHRFESCALRH